MREELNFNDLGKTLKQERALPVLRQMPDNIGISLLL